MYMYHIFSVPQDSISLFLYNYNNASLSYFALKLGVTVQLSFSLAVPIPGILAFTSKLGILILTSTVFLSIS